MILKPLLRKDLKVFDEQELWDQGRTLGDYFSGEDLEKELFSHIFEDDPAGTDGFLDLVRVAKEQYYYSGDSRILEDEVDDETDVR